MNTPELVKGYRLLSHAEACASGYAGATFGAAHPHGARPVLCRLEYGGATLRVIDREPAPDFALDAPETRFVGPLPSGCAESAAVARKVALALHERTRTARSS